MQSLWKTRSVQSRLLHCTSTRDDKYWSISWAHRGHGPNKCWLSLATADSMVAMKGPPKLRPAVGDAGERGKFYSSDADSESLRCVYKN
jgi:hypothetical protein